MDQDTVLCISVAIHPGEFGMTLHNAGYRSLSLNYAYKAFGTNDIAGTIAGVRALGIRGCSISMPFKESVIPYLDALDGAAKAIGAVNTVVNDRGLLTGHNTDGLGAMGALSELRTGPHNRVLVLGAGGAAKAIIHSLLEGGYRSIRVAGRSPARLRELQVRFHPIEPVPWDDRCSSEAELLINATPVGMGPYSAGSPIPSDQLPRFRQILDVVVSASETPLVRDAMRLGLPVVPGLRMCLHQAAAQFRLYTGCDAPVAAMERALMSLLEAQRRPPEARAPATDFRTTA